MARCPADGAAELDHRDRVRVLATKGCGVQMTVPVLVRLVMISGLSLLFSVPGVSGQATPFSIPTIDLAGEINRQVVVDWEPGQYLGHPTTVLLEDHRSILVVYPQGPGRGPIVMKRSPDGGLTWGSPEVVTDHPDADLCEPGAIRSPDGSTIALLLRENSRTHNSFVVFSTDEGKTWTDPRELPAALTGDRHTAYPGVEW